MPIDIRALAGEPPAADDEKSSARQRFDAMVQKRTGQSAKSAPSTLKQVAGMALPLAGGVAGAFTPVPGGMALGAGAGEYAREKLLGEETSPLDIGLTAGLSMVPGGFMAKRIASPLLAGMAENATLGAAYPAVRSALRGEWPSPTEMGESAVLGGGIGALGHGVGKLLPKRPIELTVEAPPVEPPKPVIPKEKIEGLTPAERERLTAQGYLKAEGETAGTVSEPTAPTAPATASVQAGLTVQQAEALRKRADTLAPVTGTRPAAAAVSAAAPKAPSTVAVDAPLPSILNMRAKGEPQANAYRMMLRGKKYAHLSPAQREHAVNQFLADRRPGAAPYYHVPGRAAPEINPLAPPTSRGAGGGSSDFSGSAPPRPFTPPEVPPARDEPGLPTRPLPDMGLSQLGQTEQGVHEQQARADMMRDYMAQRGTPIPREAGSVNLNRAHSLATIKRATLAAADLHIADPPMTHEQTIAAARDVGMTPSKLRALDLPGQLRVLQAHVTAARQLLDESGRYVMELSKSARTSSDPAHLFDFVWAATQHSAIYEDVAGAATGAGRLLNSYNIRIGKLLGFAEQRLHPAGSRGAGGGDVEIPGITGDERSTVIAKMLHKQRAGAAALNEMLSEVGGPEKVRQFADYISRLDEDAAKKMLRKNPRQQTQSKMFRLYLNSLLSSPVTMTVKGLSDASMVLWDMGDRAVQTGIGHLTRSPDRLDVREGVVQAQAFYHGILDSLTAMKKGFEAGAFMDPTFDTGVTRMGLEDPATAARRVLLTGEQRYGKSYASMYDTPEGHVRTPGTAERLLTEGFPGEPIRNLKMIDEFWKGIVYRMEVARLTAHEGFKRGYHLNSPEMRTLRDQWGRELPEEIAAAAEHKMNTLTQTRQLGNFAGPVSSAIEKIPGLKWLAPFRRVPANLVKTAVEHSPMHGAAALGNLAANAVRSEPYIGEALQSFRDPHMRDLAIARMMTGSALMALAGSYALSDRITGGGPLDPKQRATWLLTHRPYSIRVSSQGKPEDQWVSFQRVEPAALLLGGAADYMQLAQHGAIDENDLTKYVRDIGIAVGRDITSRTYFHTLANVFESVMSGNGMKINAMLSALAASWIPNLSAQVARTTDPMQRDPLANARGIKDPLWQLAQASLDQMKAKIPVASQSLPARRDVAGAPVKAEGAWPAGTSMVSPFYKSTMAKDPVGNELLRLGIGLSYARQSIPARWVGGKAEEKVQLPPAAFEKYQSIHDEEMRKSVSRIMALPSYQQWPPKVQATIIRKALRGIRVATLARMRPELAAMMKPRQPVPETPPN